MEKKSTADQIVEQLREAILRHDLPPGTPLIEANLAEEFGVSKTPVREALQRLAYAGLVDLELARGATVHTLTEDEIRDIFDLRLLVEPVALRQSADALTSEDLDALDQILDTAADAIEDKNLERLSQLNAAFHQQLIEKAHNQIMLEWLSRLSDRRQLISIVGWRQENRSELELNEHRSIVAALRAGNAALAAKRLEDHIKRFADIFSDHT